MTIHTFFDSSEDTVFDFIIRAKFNYQTESYMNMKFISQDMWKDLSRAGTNYRYKSKSISSSSPLKISIDSIDQPIPEKLAFFIGINTTNNYDGTILDLELNLKYPKAFGDDPRCSSHIRLDKFENEEYISLKNIDKEMFCYFEGIEIEDDEKEFIIYAKAEYAYEFIEEISLELTSSPTINGGDSSVAD